MRRKTLRGERKSGMGLTSHVERIEREIIRKTLKEHDWNQTRAAKVLRLKRTCLQYKMKKYQLRKPEGA